MKYTIKSFQKEFPDDDTCLEYIFESRYDDLECLKCRRTGMFYRVRGRKAYACSCGYQFNPLVGTIFEKSSTELGLWFFAIYLFSQSKQGVSAKELQRQLGITYKTAWRMGHKIRSLMKQTPSKRIGTFEMDETYFGGKMKGGRGRSVKQKTPVFGILERESDVYAVAVPNVQRLTLSEHIFKVCGRDSSIMTDEFNVYHDLSPRYLHDTVEHGIGEYVRGSVHTNGIEGFWSQVKRFIKSTYASVSKKYLQAYLDEIVWRYNRRRAAEPLFSLLLREAVK